MKTVKEMANVSGVSVRTLHHYDAIGLLKPTKVSEAGYRLYDEAAQHRLFLIMLYRELGFPLKKIEALLTMEDSERNRCLQQQIQLMQKKKEQLQNRITMAQGIKLTGVKNLESRDFDIKKIDEYSAQAKALWGRTDAYREYEKKSQGRSKEKDLALGEELMTLFAELGTLREAAPESDAVQAWVARLQSFITDHYYTCTKPVLMGLGQMYAGGGSMTENIDNAGGQGTGEFAMKAIEHYCR